MRWLHALGPDGSLWWLGGSICGLAFAALIIVLDLSGVAR